ncbi:formate hydrogenlyase [Mangrovitalea sediminis]|uniref:formate hydrogenlyase n=1 Tax=Mangrovitalea sediminis TaxID=1982043 RepID=UPI000BE61C52|nr:formate hydrogenlyase [Mangrovitalea sediminis]
MFFSQLALYEQAILALAAVVLLLTFLMLVHPRILSVIKLFAWQGLAVAATTALVAYDANAPHLYISALLTLLLKAFFIPWLLLRMVDRFDLHQELDSLSHPVLVLFGGIILVVFCYHTTLPVAAQLTAITHNVVAICMSVVLLGMVMLISRRKAVTQVVGFMALENGLFFAAVAVTEGMPMVVELGVAFDVLVAAIIFGIFFLHLRQSIDSLDTSRLSRLSERERD